MKSLRLSAMLLAFAAVSTARAEVKVGETAPAFSLQDQTGKTVSLADFKGKVVVLEWFNNECPYVQKHYKQGHMNQLAADYKQKDVVWLAINSTSGKGNDDNAKIAGEWKVERPILNDASGDIGKAYGAKRTPQMFVVDKDGKLAYMGAIDSDRSDDAGKNDSATNYVSAAVDALLAGKKVENAQTNPYGCTVKYAN